MKTKNETRYDIIGDIHGHADTARALLAKLGYVEHNGAYRHPERIAIFVGDLIDRGPKIRETLQIVRAMIEVGTALAVMGNHEYNALAFHTPDGNGAYLRPHTPEKVAQHQATLDQIVTPDPAYWRDCLEWFTTLPLFLDLRELRIVHACWDDEHIAILGGNNRLAGALLRASAIKGTPAYRTIETLLKGKEIALPEGNTFADKEGTIRHEIRVKWWMPSEGKTYYDLSLPTYDTAPRFPVPFDESLERGYAEAAPPVIVGHYWLPPATPAPLTPNVACVDYSVAKEGGMLVAYRWDGEAVLDSQKFVAIYRVEDASTTAPVPPNTAPALEPYAVMVDDNFHYMDEDERYCLGRFSTHEAAITTCKQIVNDFLVSAHRPGMSAKELFKAYTTFGEDPWIIGGMGFSAWTTRRPGALKCVRPNELVVTLCRWRLPSSAATRK